MTADRDPEAIRSVLDFDLEIVSWIALATQVRDTGGEPGLAPPWDPVLGSPRLAAFLLRDRRAQLPHGSNVACIPTTDYEINNHNGVLVNAAGVTFDWSTEFPWDCFFLACNTP